MTRHTRPQIERLEMIAVSVNRAQGSLVKTIAVCVVFAGASGALIAAPFATDWRWHAFGAGVAALPVLVLVIVVFYSLGHDALRQRTGARPNGDDWPFPQTGPNTRTRLPDSWTMREYREYMTAVRDNEARFSERGAREFGGYDADKFKALLQWVIDREWYETRNEGTYDNQNSGDWIVGWDTILPTTPAGGNG